MDTGSTAKQGKSSLLSQAGDRPLDQIFNLLGNVVGLKSPLGPIHKPLVPIKGKCTHNLKAFNLIYELKDFIPAPAMIIPFILLHLAK